MKRGFFKKSLKYSCSKSARKYYLTSLFTLLQTQFLSDFLAGIRGSNLGRSVVDFCLPSIFYVKSSSYEWFIASNGDALASMFSRKSSGDLPRSFSRKFSLIFSELWRKMSSELLSEDLLQLISIFHEIIRSYFCLFAPFSLWASTMVSRNNLIIFKHKRNSFRARSSFCLYFHEILMGTIFCKVL